MLSMAALFSQFWAVKADIIENRMLWFVFLGVILSTESALSCLEISIIWLTSIVEVVGVHIALSAKIRFAGKTFNSELAHVYSSLFWYLSSKLIFLFEVRSSFFNLHYFSTFALNESKQLNHFLSLFLIFLSLKFSYLVKNSINYLKCWFHFQYVFMLTDCFLHYKFNIFVRTN